MTSRAAIDPPIAPRRVHHHRFGRIDGEDRGERAHYPAIIREDQYHWLRDDKRERREVLHYLKQENLYCESLCEEEGIDKLQKELYQENLSHYKEDDCTVPVPEGNWFYYSKTLKDCGYSVYCRRQRSHTVPTDHQTIDDFPTYTFSVQTGFPIGPEIVLFDVNQMAKGHDSYYFHGFEPNHDHTILAYSIDTKGDETYDIKLKTFDQGKSVYHDCISKVDHAIVWDQSGKYLFYLGFDVAYRPYKLFMHRLGTKQEEDLCLYEETDQLYLLHIARTSSKRFLYIQSRSSESSEVRLFDLNRFGELCKLEDEKIGFDLKQKASSLLSVFAKRQNRILYDLDHWNEYFLIVTNKDQSMEGKLCVCKIDEIINDDDFSHWNDVFKYDSSIHFESIYCFSEYAVLSGRQYGSPQLWIIKPNIVMNNEIMNFDQSAKRIEMPESSYSCKPLENLEFNTTIFRYQYESLTIPKQTIEYDMATNQSIILHTVEVPNFNSHDYESTTLYAPSYDAGRFNIPISLVWKRTFYSNGMDGELNAPLILRGYGSYGCSDDPEFRFDKLVYLNRGYVFAIAHVRGGGELGRFWYEEEGKYFNKKNTFYDFITCIEYLQQRKITTPKKTTVFGRSAGGMLIGTCINLRSDLINIAVAEVPFVDVLNSMSDPLLPLTAGEWLEWGNPNELKSYYYLLEYSPYDNIQIQHYPNILFVSGLNDQRVGYWEPAKFVAKLRTMKTDNNLLILKTDMSSGHFSQSDRYKFIEMTSFVQAFIIHILSKA